MGFKKEYKIYGDLLFQHKPTIRSLIMHILYNKFINNERAKLPVYRENAMFKDPNAPLEAIPTKYIALVQNGTVKELIRLHQESADILLSKKTKMIEFSPQVDKVKKGMKYDGVKFYSEELDEKD